MCGIIGVASRTPSDNSLWVDNSINLLRHRGPDSSGKWYSSDRRVYLGHTRLSILDLSINANQPMSDSENKIHIVFNGEIYNFNEIKSKLLDYNISFNTGSDTEVVLYAYKIWGELFIEYLQGMFSIAIYDSILEKLILIRDRIGEKPLYYWHNQNAIYFSSESKTFNLHKDFDRKIDIEAFNSFLSLGFVPNDKSIFKQIKKLSPANYLVYNLNDNTFFIQEYWNINSSKAIKRNLQPITLQDDLYNLLDNSIKQQLISDVPVGVLLSGGTDSSLITAIASKYKQIDTFHIRFPDSNDQGDYHSANLISKYFSTNHHVFDAESTSIDMLPILASQLDDPIIDSSIIPMYLVSKLVVSKSKVVLGGDGGDELFGGYKHYQRISNLYANTKYLPFFIRNSVSSFILRSYPLGWKGKNWVNAFGINFNKSTPLIAKYFDVADRIKLLKNKNNFSVYPEKYWLNSFDFNKCFLANSMEIDFKNYLVEDILVKSDRMSMLNSLEVRSPFLDHKIVEFAFNNVPLNLKISTTDRKIILKKLAKKILPIEFNTSRKQGFSIPLKSWMKSPIWKNYFKEVLLDNNQDVFSKSSILKLLDNKYGLVNYEAIFGLVIFELWRNNNKAMF